MVVKLLKESTVELGASPADPVAIAFASYRLDLKGSRLLQGARPIPLRPKTWAVLLYLVEHPAALVTRDELLDAVWADIAVTPDTINKSIGELRVALDDDSHAPRFIETVHRRGFRFIAETQRIATREPLSGNSSTVLLEHPVSHADGSTRPFVGREEELALLATRFARADAGERQVVFVTGPAGVGKTALVDAFLNSRAVQERRGPVWIGRGGCIEVHGPQEPYMAVLDALERLARPPHVKRLAKLMQRTAPLWLAQMPWLLAEKESAALRRTLEGVRPERMPRELAVLIEALTTDLTLLLVLEDLHWSDPSTADLLTLLAQRRDPARLMVIGTYRPAELVVREHVLRSAVRTLQVQKQCAELPLHDFSREGVWSYLTARFPGNDFPPALASLIHAHTGGQPLFLVATVDHMLSRGWILDTAPGWGLSTPLEMIELGVPDDVRRMIEIQLDDLSPAERSLLEAASVAGHEITAPVMASALTCPISVAELHCETLARAQRFLRADGMIEWSDGTADRRYVFAHELHRQIVYDQIPEGRRIRLHRGVGEALEAAHGGRADEMALQLAAHFQHAHDPLRVVRYLTAAGVRARRRFASREAVAYLESALSWVALLPDGGERRRQERDVRLALGRALADVHGFASEPVRENYERVSQLCAEPDGAAHSFEALYARWYVHALRAERDETLASASELQDLARRLNTAAHGVVADSVLVRTAFYDGRFTDARRHMESLRARQPEQEEVESPVGYGVDPVIAATMHCAGALWFLGDPERARAMGHAGLAQARDSGNPLFLSAALEQTAMLNLLGRNSAEAYDLAAQAQSLAAAQGFAFWYAVASAMKGWAQIQLGQAAQGIGEVERALAALQATGARFSLAYLYAFLAEGRLNSGAHTEGLTAADAGLAVTATTLDRGYEPELWRLKGELLLASAAAPRRAQRSKRTSKSVAAAPDSQWPEAERCLLRALELSRAAGAKSLELRTATSLARAWQKHGRIAEARALLIEICDWFDAGLATPDLVEARAQHDELTVVT